MDEKYKHKGVKKCCDNQELIVIEKLHHDAEWDSKSKVLSIYTSNTEGGFDEIVCNLCGEIQELDCEIEVFD